MASAAHDQARNEGDAFAKKYWEETGFGSALGFNENDNSPFTINQKGKPNGTGLRSIYQWPTGRFPAQVETFMLNSALAAIENEAGALASTRRKWVDDSVVLAWKEAAQAQAVKLLKEVTRLPLPTGRS